MRPGSHWWSRVGAVMACALAPAQDALHERVNRALETARPALRAHLRTASQPDGHQGTLALITLAAVHDGLDEKDEVFARAVKRLAAVRPGETYDLALRLMVMEALPSFPDREKLAAGDAKQLLRHASHDGGFGYGTNRGNWDLSNSQYGALGLRAARALGVKIERAVWQRLATCIGDQQGAYGGFDYSRGGNDPYASMTAAGIAVLAICRQALDDGGTAPKSLDGRIERGWQWFDRNVASIGSTKERWSYYFHYGLERAAILCDVKVVGGKDWYELGATMLVDEQLPGGGWQSTTDGFPGGRLQGGQGDLVPTAFAVLFLRRKFQKVPTPITVRVVNLVNIGPASKPADIEACTAELVRRGKPAMPEILNALRSEIEPQRRAAAGALQQIAGETFGFDAGKDAADNRDAVRKAELWYLKNRG